MTKPHDIDDEPRDGADDGAAPAAELGESSAPDAREFEAAVREREEFRANWQRAQADYQNLRRRMAADNEAAVQRAKKQLLLDLLLVLDYLDMALGAPVTTQEGKDLRAGVEMTRGTLFRTLEREGLRAVPDTGAFDATLHEAVDSVEAADVPDGHIVQTLRRGYTMNGHVLRPAQVRVAKTKAAAGANTLDAARGSGDREES